MNKPMSLREVAALLHVQPYQIQYLFAQRRLAEPVNRIAGHRVFEQEDIIRLARHFKVALAGEQAETHTPKEIE